MELDPERAKLPWYALHTYSGFEQRVKMSLEERVRNNNLTAKFGNIIVPQESVEELVRGKKRTSSRKIYPGYIMVQMHLDDDTWHLVNGTPKVTGFIGDSCNPLPLTEQEVKDLIGHIEGGSAKPRARITFEEGDQVKVIDGPFTDFNAVVEEVKPDKGKVKVLISIFGRSTPVELDFVQVEKL
ncbi:MAG: transcription termination/antitermination protein NusG [Deltaproteobacteria bacterium]|nr:transcription termination/antitermination protein NusG [Deltaproteobacteria bacterium]